MRPSALRAECWAEASMLRKSGHSAQCGRATSSVQSKSANCRRCVLTIGVIRPEPSCRPLMDRSLCSGRSASLRDHPPKAQIGDRPPSAFQLPRGLPRPRRLRKKVLPSDAVCWDCPSFPPLTACKWYGSEQSWARTSRRRNETGNRAIRRSKFCDFSSEMSNYNRLVRAHFLSNPVIYI